MSPTKYLQSLPPVYPPRISFLALISLSCSFTLLAQGPVVSPAPALACRVSEISRTPLVVENGRELYVDARGFSAAPGGEVLLLGGTTLLFVRDAGGAQRLVRQDSVLGAVIGPGGAARSVAFPTAARRVGAVTALARPEGGWDVAFAEMRVVPGPPGAEPTEAVAGLWHGVYDGHAWSEVEKLPALSDSIVLTDRSAALVRQGGTLAWALAANTAPLHHRVVAVYERRGGDWSTEIVSVPGAAYLALRFAGPNALQLALVAADSSIRPGEDQNSLFVWEQRPAWHQARRVWLGGVDGPAHLPVLADVDGRAALGWVNDAGRGREARLLLDPLSAGDVRPVLLDSSIDGWGEVTRVRTGQGRTLWLTEHDTRDGSPRQIRFHGNDGVETLLVGEIPSPFRAGFHAVAVGREEILLSGTPLIQENDPVFSLLLRVRVQCPPRP